MAFEYPIPTAGDWDYIPVDPAAITVGTPLWSALDMVGVIEAITPADPGDAVPFWSFDLTCTQPDGTPAGAVAGIPDDPDWMPPYWWQRQRICLRAPKPQIGEPYSGPDGSMWIYSGGDGRGTCYLAGSTWARGARAFRGEMYLRAYDVYSGADEVWDWFPVYDQSVLQVGDTIRYGVFYSYDVDEITDVDHEGWRRREFRNAGAVIGFVDDLTPSPAGSLQPDSRQWAFRQRQAAPTPGSTSLWEAQDGSRWVYIDDGQYLCWYAGSRYSYSAICRRLDITGGLRVWPE